MKYLVISSSLNPKSRSRELAKAAFKSLQEQRPDSGFLDLVEHPLPFCDGAAAYGDANVQKLDAQIETAHGILLAVPIYNFDVNAVAKNLLELTGAAWEGKVVGFICAAGGHGSYMSVMPFANSLMLDFRCLILPRFVYALKNSPERMFSETEVQGRLAGLAAELIRVTEALFPEA